MQGSGTGFLSFSITMGTVSEGKISPVLTVFAGFFWLSSSRICVISLFSSVDMVSVSYTHLDVYKRQVSIRVEPIAAAVKFCGASTGEVLVFAAVNAEKGPSPSASYAVTL